MKKTVILAEDNINCSKDIFNTFKKNGENIEIIRLYDDGNEALKSIKEYEPDFLILDLNLPGKNGIDIIKDLQQENDLKTKIIVISGEISMINRLNLIKNKMVSNIFIKPFKTQDLYNTIKYEENNNYINMEEYINQILHNFNFNFTSQFYRYLLLSIEESLYRPFVLSDIYKEVSKKSNINQKQIKWGIEKLILSMVRYTPLNIIKKYIPYSTSPTPKVFIYEIVQIVKKNIEIENTNHK